MSKMKVSENTNLTLDLKTIFLIVGFTISLGTMWANLNASIEEAKKLPEPTLTESEWRIKDELIRTTILQNADGIQEIKDRLSIIENRLYEIKSQ